MSAAQAAELKALTRTQFQSFAEKYLWLLVAIGIAIIIFFVWLYLREWRKRRAFSRYWDRGRKRPARQEPGALAITSKNR